MEKILNADTLRQMMQSFVGNKTEILGEIDRSQSERFIYGPKYADGFIIDIGIFHF